MKILNIIFIYIILVSCKNPNINVLDLNLDELTKYKIELSQEIHQNGINESILSDELISEYLLNPSNVYINNVYDKDFLEKIIKRGDYLRSLNNYSIKQNEYLNFKINLLPKPEPLPTVNKSENSSNSFSQPDNSSYSQNGTYSYSSGDVELSMNISGDSWTGRTKICEYCDVEYDSGIVYGSDLYDSSGSVKIGNISGNTISTFVGSSRVTLRK